MKATSKALAGMVTLAALPQRSDAGVPNPAQGRPAQTPAIPPDHGADSRETLRIATCQFPVSGDPAENGKYIRGFMEQATGAGAHLLHTSEACLSGYAGTDFPSFEGFDWGAVRQVTTGLRELAKQLRLWLVLGSAHFLDPETRPTNCLYLIDPEGRITNRYDKCFCTEGDQKHYSAGERLVTHDIRGVRIGLAICYDICWPQLYIGYREKGATVMSIPSTTPGPKARTVWTRSTSARSRPDARTIACGRCATTRHNPIPTGDRSSPGPMPPFPSNWGSTSLAC